MIRSVLALAFALCALPAHAQPTVSLADFTTGPELALQLEAAPGDQPGAAERLSLALSTPHPRVTVPRDTGRPRVDQPAGTPTGYHEPPAAEPWDWSWPFLLIGFGLDYASTVVGIEEYGLGETAPGREGADVWTILAVDVAVLGLLRWLGKRFPDSRVLRGFRWGLGGAKTFAAWNNFQLIGEIHDRRRWR